MWKLQERIPATLLVMRSFSILHGASRGCVAFRDPTAFLGSRLSRIFMVGFIQLIVNKSGCPGD